MDKFLIKALWALVIAGIALFGYLVLVLANQIKHQKTITTTVQVIKKYSKTTLIMVPAGKVMVPNLITTYYTDVVENDRKTTYEVEGKLFEQIEAGKTYNVTKKTLGTGSFQIIILKSRPAKAAEESVLRGFFRI